MSTLFRKVLNTGVGAAVMAKRRADDLKKELLEKSKASEEKGQEVLQEYSDISNERKQVFEDEIKALVEKVLRKMNIPTRSEMKVLEKRIKTLEKAISDKDASNE